VSRAGRRSGGKAERSAMTQPERLDELQRLWTPWRLSYIKREDSERIEGCPFCVLPARGPEHDADSLILHRGQRCYVILNAYPYNPGHFMSVPYRHVARFTELSREELHEMADLCQDGVGALSQTSGPDAFNMGINDGEVAGAGIADHIHQHVVPRWRGDTNFMPVVGQTRVLPQMLEEAYQQLAPVFAALSGPHGV
jgi:ATP adenylyltransferase